MLKVRIITIPQKLIRSSIRHAIGLLALMACCIYSVSCNRPPPQPAELEAGTYRLDHFTDIGIPAGFVPMTGVDHVAMALADGDLRILHTTLVAHQQLPQEPKDWQEHFEPRLIAAGWELTNADGGSTIQLDFIHQRRNERLKLVIKRLDGHVTIHLQLSPRTKQLLPNQQQ